MNQGKGHAVARGMLHASGAYRFSLTPTWRTRAARSPSSCGRWSREAKWRSRVACCRITLRDEPDVFPLSIHATLMSRVFNRLAQQVLLPGILDTQAGLKGFTAPRGTDNLLASNAVRLRLRPRMSIHRASARLKIEQVPVDFIIPDEPSTNLVCQACAEMLMDLVASAEMERVVSTPSPTRLIINADDFGISRGVNIGIVEAAKAGVVTAASLIVNLPDFADALDRAAVLPRSLTRPSPESYGGRPLTAAHR